MALFSLRSVKIDGISACVPKNNVSNHEANSYLNEADLKKIMQSTGIENRRIAEPSMTTSDLCLAAAERLIAELNWKKSDIEVLIFVSQTPDYILPVTSALLQDRLGLPKSCMALDITLGCSGYVYGLSTIGSILSATRTKKGLLLVGDTSSKLISSRDRSTFPLFGDAGTATALSYDEAAERLDFNLSTDGSGYEAIIVPHGGHRTPATLKSFEENEFEGNIFRNSCQLHLNGIDVFNFGISQAPKSIKELLSFNEINIDRIDYFVFHQANKLMNETIRKGLKLPPERVPYTLKQYGNTSSATIPLTFVSELRERACIDKLTSVFCGFGVGLSWGSVRVTTDKIVCPEVIEI